MYIKKSISLPLPRNAFMPPSSLHLMRNSKTKQRSASTVAKSQARVRNCKVNVDGCGTATRKHNSLCLLDITDTQMCPTHSNIPFPSSRSPYRPSIWSLRDRFGKSFIIGLAITVKRYANPKKTYTRLSAWCKELQTAGVCNIRIEHNFLGNFRSTTLSSNSLDILFTNFLNFIKNLACYCSMIENWLLFNVNLNFLKILKKNCSIQNVELPAT